MYENGEELEDDTLNFSTKYRPRSLKTFIAPSTTKTLLESMVDKNRFPKVMLITGRTSAGKTSLARILGHAINGLKADEVCEDYYEMNMGDSKGIDEARNLSASLKYKPLKYPKKVIVLDEAHCITAAAASALLKPLEEPPAHVVFILCTDNPEKLLPTIRNRCTQIQLETPTPDLLVPMLKRVCKKENIKLDDDVLLEIADSADGQPRQALQTLQNIAGMIEGIKDKKQLKKVIEDAKVTILKNDEDREAIMFLLSLYSKNGPVCMTTVSNAGDYTAFINKALNYNRFIFDQMLYKFKKEKVKGYYWTPNRQKFFDQVVKKCSEWQSKAVEIHSLLVDIRQQMGTYTVGEYHLVMSKCLTYINTDDEGDE